MTLLSFTPRKQNQINSFWRKDIHYSFKQMWINTTYTILNIGDINAQMSGIQSVKKRNAEKMHRPVYVLLFLN